MIPPGEQWCIQIDVTNACPRRCSNCTRMLAHSLTTWHMPVEVFERAVHALADFPLESPPDRQGRVKRIGIIGGEPLLHPDFHSLCRLLAEAVPDPRHRGLWTGLHWQSHPHREIVEETFPPGIAYINPNDHSGQVYHHPVLVASRDVLGDTPELWSAIQACELQELWSGTITPKGFFFCEVAGAFDMVFGGPGGVPIEPGCWAHGLDAYRAQMLEWCPRCGMCLRELGKRRDREGRDDISGTNLSLLRALGSPRVLRGDYVPYQAEASAAGPFQGASSINYLKGH